MESVNVILLTGPGSAAQGWGDSAVTEQLRQSIVRCGFPCTVAEVSDRAAFDTLDFSGRPLVWSSLYHLGAQSERLGCFDQPWVAELLEERSVAFIGSSGRALRRMADKFVTLEIIAGQGIPVPDHMRWNQGGEPPHFPVFVKPSTEACSIGVDESSVCMDRASLAEQVRKLREMALRDVIVETFLPGREYTCMVLGNEAFAGEVTLDSSWGVHPVLTAAMRGIGLTKISGIADPIREKEVMALSLAAAAAVEARDHVRVDLREDASGNVRVMEVNGIPGLKKHSWSPQLFALHRGENNAFDRLIGRIVRNAMRRAYP